MLFSCLVDADFLDTEAYMNPEKKLDRGGYLPLPDLTRRFQRIYAEKLRRRSVSADTTVNRARQQVLADCRSAAQLEPGLFSLTVPTGGGKTLSSMAFALEHAVKYGKERVIYVIPYTSIIEQNADVFREAVGGTRLSSTTPTWTTTTRPPRRVWPRRIGTRPSSSRPRCNSSNRSSRRRPAAAENCITSRTA